MAAATTRRGAGHDRLTVALLSLATFLVVLSLLASQLGPASARVSRGPAVVVRKIYRTTVVETIVGGSGKGGTSVSQSVSHSGSYSASTAPTTRTS